MSSRRLRVLLAEDDDCLRNLLVRVLTSRGYDVVQARDGVQLTLALRLHERQKPDMPVAFDVIVTDYRMPGRTGVQALESADLGGAPERVVLMSSFAGPELAAWAASAGVACVLAKPFATDDFLQAVGRVAGGCALA